MFRHEGSRWVETHELRAGDWAGGDEFGESDSVSRPFVVVGAPREDFAGSDAGAAYVYPSRTELELIAWPSTVRAGDTLLFSTSFGYPGDPVGLAIVKANGIPMFQFVAIASFENPSHKWRLLGQVPPGLAGLDATFQSFGLDMLGRTGISDREEIEFR